MAEKENVPLVERWNKESVFIFEIDDENVVDVYVDENISKKTVDENEKSN
jgi:hypothetical protein